jgi:hypothetical protein
MAFEPDPRWLPFLKVFFGFLLLFILAALAAIIGLGKVEATTSYGLDIILGGLLTLSGGFAQWCFGQPKKNDDEVK